LGKGGRDKKPSKTNDEMPCKMALFSGVNYFYDDY